MTTLVLLDEFNFHARLAQTHGPALVIFTGAGCSSCRAWKRLLDSLAGQQPGLSLFEVDAGLAQALTHEFGVFHLPALFLFLHGHFHAALQCEARLTSLKSAIASALASPPDDPP